MSDASEYAKCPNLPGQSVEGARHRIDEFARSGHRSVSGDSQFLQNPEILFLHSFAVIAIS